MSPLVLTYALQALNAIPSLIAAGQSIAGLVNQTNAAVQKMIAENREPTAAEWADQAKVISDLRAILHAPSA